MSEEGFFARRVFFERKENGDAVFRLSYPLRLAPLDTSPHISVSLNFFGEKI